MFGLVSRGCALLRAVAVARVPAPSRAADDPPSFSDLGQRTVKVLAASPRATRGQFPAPFFLRVRRPGDLAFVLVNYCASPPMSSAALHPLFEAYGRPRLSRPLHEYTASSSR